MQKMQETAVQSLSQGDPLEEEMAAHSSILAWEIPRTEEPGGLQSTGSQELDTAERLSNSKRKQLPRLYDEDRITARRAVPPLMPNHRRQRHQTHKPPLAQGSRTPGPWTRTALWPLRN